MTDPIDTDFSPLLWTLGLLVAGLAWHLSNGWLRVAQRGPTLCAQWPALLLAGGTLGLGLNAALVLGLQAQPMGFALGFMGLGSAGLLLLGWAGCAPVVMLPASGTRAWQLLLSGASLAVLALALQVGWVLAAGFRPGVVWRHEVLAGAGVVQAMGLMLARWLAFSAASEASPRRAAWRGAGALLGGATVMAGLQLVVLAAGLDAQNGSLYEHQLPGTVLSVVAGVLVPLVMGAMVLDLWLRRLQRPRRGEAELQPRRRRKRRRMRTL